jgi:hypothetical protein
VSVLARIKRRLADESGFTLMELLVASLLGIIVIMAAAAIMDAAQGETTRITQRVDGTQRGRVAMEQITQRLRSQVCVGTSTPILDAQDNSITFYADLGDETFNPEKRHIFVQNGQLIEEIFVGTGTPPTQTFPSTPTSTRLMTANVVQARDSAGNLLPYFRYYAYDTGTPSEPNLLLGTPVSAANLPQIARVLVAFRIRAPNQDERVDTTFSDAVVSRMANPSDPDPTLRGPQCTTS